MNFLAILGLGRTSTSELPSSVREIQDIRGVRVIRLQGSVGKEIGAEAKAMDAAAKAEGVFNRSLLFDFKETTDWDFSTISYLVLALRHRMAAHARVGIINAPPQLLAELEIAKIEGMFTVFSSEEQALADLGSRRESTK